MRLFGGERLQGLMDKLKIDDDTPIEAGMVSNSIESAQRKVESRNFAIRKNVLQYDEVMNSQRQIIYSQRDQVLNGDSQTHAAMSAAYETAGLELLGIQQYATYRLTTANRDLKTLADFKGLQIRTMENGNHMAFWTAIGAAPTPLAWAEVFIALQNGTIDAHENAADTVLGANIQEVQKYLACTNHILYANQLSMNKEKYDSLDPAYQAAIVQAVEEAIEEMKPEMKNIDETSKQALVDGGMTLIEYDDSFYQEILALDTVQALYDKIDADVNGLGTTLQEELAAAQG